MRWSILLLAAVSLSGCKQEPVSTGDTQAVAVTEAHAPPADSDVEERSEPAPAAIELVEPGKKPRRALRWSTAPGRRERITMRVDTELEASLVVLNARQAPRSVAFELSFQTDEPAGEGRRVVSLTVNDARLLDSAKTPPKALKARQEAVAAMRGFEGSYRVDSLGTVDQVVMKLPSDASRELWGIAGDLAWALRQLAAPFPEEPIGTGATWTIARGVEQDGVDANEVSTLELTKLREPLVTVKAEVRQSAAPQTFRNPGSSIDAELTKYAAEGSGEVTWDPTRLVPRSGEWTFSVTKEMQYAFEGKSVKSRMITRRTLTVLGDQKSRP